MTDAGRGSAGDADYRRIASGYRTYRRPEPEFETAIASALGGATTVLNVGAGAGSYEPTDRDVTAVEPSAEMRAQRPADRVPAIDATAERLPFPDDAFDAAMTTFSVHQWHDLDAGLREMRRVTRGPVIVMTCDPDRLDRYWLADYAPEVVGTEARRYPALDRIDAALTGRVEPVALPIPLGCADGFSEAYYGRPEKLLDPGARKANSAWSFVAPEVEQRFVTQLSADLESGHWDRKYGRLRQSPHFDGSLVLLVSRPSG